MVFSGKVPLSMEVPHPDRRHLSTHACFRGDPGRVPAYVAGGEVAASLPGEYPISLGSFPFSAGSSFPTIVGSSFLYI